MKAKTVTEQCVKQNAACNYVVNILVVVSSSTVSIV